MVCYSAAHTREGTRLDKKVTMRQIGKAMGVSTVTVSKALGGKDGVSETVRAQIIDKAREMGYQYPLTGKALREGMTFDVGILVPDRFFSDTSFYAALYKRLVQHLAEFNCYGILEILYAADEKELKLPAVMRSGKADAVIVIRRRSPSRQGRRHCCCRRFSRPHLYPCRPSPCQRTAHSLPAGPGLSAPWRR